MTTLADTLLAHSRTLGSVEPRRDGTVSLSLILAADMASAMRAASGRLEELEMERDAARRAASAFFVQPTMDCPRCGTEYPDFDGVGVMFCPACRYCRHPSRDLKPEGWVCGICGDVKPRDEEVAR